MKSIKANERVSMVLRTAQRQIEKILDKYDLSNVVCDVEFDSYLNDTDYSCSIHFYNPQYLSKCEGFGFRASVIGGKIYIAVNVLEDAVGYLIKMNLSKNKKEYEKEHDLFVIDTLESFKKLTDDIQRTKSK